MISSGSQHHDIQEQRFPRVILLSSYIQRLLGRLGEAARHGDSADTDTNDTSSGYHTDMPISQQWATRYIRRKYYLQLYNLHISIGKMDMIGLREIKEKNRKL